MDNTTDLALHLKGFFMKVTGIIAEYNPFHHGHAYQIRTIKQQLHSDYVIVIMSGDFVQRGEPAIVDKYARAQMALEAGADLVLEMPVRFSTASAPYFALGGVGILDRLGCVDSLCFGTESGDAAAFYRIARWMIDEPEDYRTALAEELKTGVSFPLARQRAFVHFCPEDSVLLQTPNNILGIEYTRALLKCNSSIRLEPILRRGNGYHETELAPMSSATAIRKAAAEDPRLIHIRNASAMPEHAWQILEDELNRKGMLTSDSFSSILGYKLLTATPEKLMDIFDLEESLANRICQNKDSFRTVNQFAELLKTKNETMLHIKRSLLHLILDLKEIEHMEMIPAYTRILGIRKESSILLRRIQEEGTIPVLTKLSKQQAAINQLDETTFASNLYQMQLSLIKSTEYRHENTRKISVL